MGNPSGTVIPFSTASAPGSSKHVALNTILENLSEFPKDPGLRFGSM